MKFNLKARTNGINARTESTDRGQGTELSEVSIHTNAVFVRENIGTFNRDCCEMLFFNDNGKATMIFGYKNRKENFMTRYCPSAF